LCCYIKRRNSVPCDFPDKKSPLNSEKAVSKLKKLVTSFSPHNTDFEPRPGYAGREEIMNFPIM
jgi:hypothetical protein